MALDKAALIRSNVGRYFVIGLTIVLCYGACIACAALAQGAGPEVFLLFTAFFAFWGWRALNRITPAIFLFLPLIGWLVYFFVKFTISAFIGWVIGPFKFGCWLGDVIFGKIEDSDFGMEDEGSWLEPTLSGTDPPAPPIATPEPPLVSPPMPPIEDGGSYGVPIPGHDRDTSGRKDTGDRETHRPSVEVGERTGSMVVSGTEKPDGSLKRIKNKTSGGASYDNSFFRRAE